MCKLLQLEGHPDKLVKCKHNCNDFTSREYVKASVLLWFITLSVGIVGLILLS